LIFQPGAGDSFAGSAASSGHAYFNIRGDAGNNVFYNSMSFCMNTESGALGVEQHSHPVKTCKNFPLH
jgi:hypothetical protein